MDPERMTTAQLIEVQSPDGTRLGVERVGSGPPLVAVHGGIGDRSRWTHLADRLADRFTLHLLDRRGRGASTRESTEPYALEREVEDVLAVIDAAGEPVRYLGHSYGALIGMEALTRTDRIERALLYEPPFDTPGHVMITAATLDTISSLIAAGDREGALDVFYRDVLGDGLDAVQGAADVAGAHRDRPHDRARGPRRPDLPPRAGALRRRDDADAHPARHGEPAPFRAAAEAAHVAIGSSDLVLLNGQGHTMIDADPDGFVRQVTDFLDD